MNRLSPALSLTAGLLALAASAQAQFGANLIVNGDAENGIAGWTVGVGNALALAYSYGGGYPTETSPGPANRGLSFFVGGDSALSTLSQSIDLGFGTAAIDAGGAGYDLSGYLGGYASQLDNASLTVTFLGVANNPLGTATLGPVTPADRGGATGLFLREASGTVPVGARTATALLTFARDTGPANDGYADNLSLTLNPVPEPASLLALGLGAAMIRRRRR